MCWRVSPNTLDLRCFGPQLTEEYQHDCDSMESLWGAMRHTVLDIRKLIKYEVFAVPLSLDPNHRCWRLIKDSVDLSTILSRIDAHEYPTTQHFMKDIYLTQKVRWMQVSCNCCFAIG